jgi:hypothetical protein
MTADDIGSDDSAGWDPGLTKRLIGAATPLANRWFQESQLFLDRGTWLAKRLGLGRLRSDILPLTIGFPFGLSMLVPINLPLPTKIVTQVLEPIDLFARFGENPDAEKVDAHVRSVMQTALDRLARQRRLPVLG